MNADAQSVSHTGLRNSNGKGSCDSGGLKNAIFSVKTFTSGNARDLLTLKRRCNVNWRGNQ